MMLNRKFIVSLSLGSLFLLGAMSCKVRQNAADLKGEIEYLDILRVNAKLKDVQHDNHFEANLKTWYAYSDNEFIITKKIYDNYWNLYQNFLIGDHEKPETMRCLRHRVHFYLKAKDTAPVVFGAEPSADVSPRTISEETYITGPRPQSVIQGYQAKSCTPEQKKTGHVLSYQLNNYRQPNLTRNFLILVKAGFYDGLAMDFWTQLPEMPYFGLPQSEQEPFYYSPDRKFTPATQEFKLAAFDNDEQDTRNLSSHHEFQVRDKIPAFIKQDYLAALTDNSAPTDLSRRSLAFRVLFTNFKNAVQEKFLNFDTSHTYPTVFGEKITPYDNSVRSINTLVKLKEIDKQSVEITCVEIQVERTQPYDVVNRRCPETIGQ